MSSGKYCSKFMSCIFVSKLTDFLIIWGAAAQHSQNIVQKWGKSESIRFFWGHLPDQPRFPNIFNCCWESHSKGSAGVTPTVQIQHNRVSRVSSKQSNFFFGLNQNKLNLFRLFIGLFRETKNYFFRFVLVCFVVSDRYRNNRNKQNFLKTNRNKPKKSPKKLGVLETVNFFLGSNRNKPKLNLFRLFFSLFWCFGPVSKQPKQTELMVWGIKKVDILTTVLLFRLIFRLFRLFRNTETPCFDIKAKQPKQTSCFG
jgi:hypothetical protein